jgi:PhnB protein
MNEAVFFAPMLYIPNGIKEVDFYSKAFGAIELRRFSNDDNTIHVVELSIHGALFHIHEQNLNRLSFHPNHHKGTTVNIGLFVPDVDAVVEKAVAAGAGIVTEAQDYDYGYRQAEIVDPFGHIWTLQKKI